MRWLSLSLPFLLSIPYAAAQDKPQYAFEKIRVPPAKGAEAILADWSPTAAAKHLDDGAFAWSKERNCVSCHTNGTYLTIRPQLNKWLGEPKPEMRKWAEEELAKLLKKPNEALRKSTMPGQLIYLAAGLAEWDAASGKTSEAAKAALNKMFEIQLDSGTWGSLDCWPPYESSAFHLATVAAQGAAVAPGWLKETKPAGWDKLLKYLRETKPEQDYDATLLLWASARVPDLLTVERKKELTDRLLSKQKPDGGWSIRSFGEPEQWGAGNRAKKLRAEPDFKHPPSDGHMTGLAIVVLRDVGIPKDQASIQKGIAWLKANQRESGRWWTRSLNTDGPHYITYSATALSLLALAKCDELK